MDPARYFIGQTSVLSMKEEELKGHLTAAGVTFQANASAKKLRDSVMHRIEKNGVRGDDNTYKVESLGLSKTADAARVNV